MSEPALPGRGRLEPGDLLTVPQALQLLPVSRASLYRLLNTGRIAAVRVAMVGGRDRVLVVRASIERYVVGETPVRQPVDVDGVLARIREEGH